MENNQAKELIPNAERGDVMCTFNIEKDGIFLKIVCASFEMELVKMYVRNDVKLALFENRGMLYFLCKFEGDGWMDAPFHSSINPPDRRGFPAGFKPGVDYLNLEIDITDITGTLGFENRRLKIEPPMAKRLYEIVCTQEKNPISLSEYNKRTAYAFSKYPVKTMVKRALSTCFAQTEPDLKVDEAANAQSEKATHKAYPLVAEFSHISPDTGHCIQQKLIPAIENGVKFCQTLIEETLKTGFLLANLGGKKYPILMEQGDGNLMVQLCLPGKKFSSDMVAVVFVININMETSALMWEKLLAKSQYARSRTKCPAAAWVGAVPVQPNITDLNLVVEYMDIMKWAGDFERTMAFAYARILAKSNN